MPKAEAVRPVGAGMVGVADPASVAANRASFYADPVAWLVDAAVGEAIPVDLEPEGVGVVVISDAPASPTTRQIAAGAARGRVSPLRFAGANPSILAGLTCIQRGFRGPAAVFLAKAEHTADVAVTTAADWLRRGHATHCALVVHRVDDAGHTARCVLITAADDETSADVAAMLAAPAREEATTGA
jgi:hypothetical protein